MSVLAAWPIALQGLILIIQIWILVRIRDVSRVRRAARELKQATQLQMLAARAQQQQPRPPTDDFAARAKAWETERAARLRGGH